MSYEDWNSRKRDVIYRDTEVFIQLEIYNDADIAYTHKKGTTTSWVSRSFKSIRVIKGKTPEEYMGGCEMLDKVDFGEYSEEKYEQATQKFIELVKEHLSF